MMRNIPINVTINRIKKSTNPIVIVEGPDDIIVYRHLMSVYKEKSLTVVPSGGRGKALNIFNHLKNTSFISNVIFIVDKDLWVFSCPPNEYVNDRIIFTTGYSLENDIYVDGKIKELLIGQSIYNDFFTHLKRYMKWYALVINRHLNNNNTDALDVVAANFLSDINIENSLCTPIAGENFPQDLYHSLLSEYDTKIRGKNLLDMAVWFLNNKKPSGIFNKNAFLIQISTTQRGQNLNRIFDSVGRLC